jgi:hypothetical protein
MFGGISSSGVCLNDLWMLDVTSLTWTHIIPSVELPRIAGSSLIVSNDQLLSIFGERQNTGVSDIIVLIASLGKRMDCVCWFSCEV